MAEVWSGVHTGQQIPVALKVITSKRAREERFRAAFRNEVQAVARLHHPGIVMVLEHGEVTEEAEAASKGQLAKGSPYLAMELASWGSLDKVKKPLRFDDLLRILLSLLDALAHAHARGVIHRDLKPGNVLLSAPTDVRPGLKLTDFGIAHALEEEAQEADSASSGTPHFMAPEQFMGSWRDYGPWTDLYAVGCLAHVLTTGKLPFDGDGAVQLAWAHLNLPPPQLDGADSVPEDFGRWVHRLLQKKPQERFLRAADAGWALMRIAEKHQQTGPGLLLTTQGGEGAPLDRAAQSLPISERSLDEIPLGEVLNAHDKPAPTILRDLRLDALTRKRRPPNPVQGGELPTELAFNDRTEAFFEDDQFSTQAKAPKGEKVEAWGAEWDQAPDPPPRVGEGDALATVVHHTRAGATLPWVKVEQFQSSAPPREGSSKASDLYPRQLPPLPGTWRRATPPGTSMKLIGAGLGLYGLRAIPMVDRGVERDAIWQALLEVRRQHQPRVIVLRGAAGNGKSRVVEWMAERADEVGSAVVLKAGHGPIPGPADGLERMVARHLRCVDMRREDALERIEARLKERGVTDPYEWQALTELVHPASLAEQTKGGQIVRFGSPTERHVLIKRLLERVQQERPVIVWLDDVQWGSDALAFSQHILDAQPRASLLLLLTVRDEALEERHLERQLLDRLLKHQATTELFVPPLSTEDQKQLVNELLVLEEGLSGEVAGRTGGNPLFAIQLVGDWVQRGVLEVGQQGFELQRGEAAELPDDIHQVWLRRINRVLVALPSSARAALELAAVLGSDVLHEEWHFSCQEAGIQIPSRLLEKLAESRLAQPNDSGFVFAHGMLRESLERGAKEADRYQQHQRACARMLHRIYSPKDRDIAERLGRHLAAAGDLEEALEPLRRGAEERFHTSQYSEAMELLREREVLLDRLALVDSDPRWGEDWVLRAQVCLRQGLLDEGERAASQAEQRARRWGWHKVLPAALETLGCIAYERGDQKTAINALERSIELYRWNKNLLGLAGCLFWLGEAVYRLGDHFEAEAHYRRGLKLAEQQDDPRTIALHLQGLGFVALWRGDIAKAQSRFRRQLRLLEGLGDRFKTAQSFRALGEAARQAGHLEQAESHYRRALTIGETIGSGTAWIDRLNLALVLLARAEYGEARAAIDQVRRQLGDSAEPAQLCLVHIQLLPCLAESKDWMSWDNHFEDATQLLRETGMKDGDLAWLLTLAAERAHAARDPVRARHAYELAMSQWRGLERADKVESLEAVIRALRPSSP